MEHGRHDRPARDLDYRCAARRAFLKLGVGALLLCIGVKLTGPVPGDDHDASIQASDKLLAAITASSSLTSRCRAANDVIAIAAAEQADPSQRAGLIIFGLLVSVPFIVRGSQRMLKLLDRLPIIVVLGGGLLGRIAGGLIVGDPVIRPLVPAAAYVGYAASAAGAVFVIALAKRLERRRARPAS